MAQTRVQVIVDAVDNASKVFKGMGGEIKKLDSNLKDLATAGTILGATTGLLARDFIKQAGAMEQNTVAFKTMLGSAEEATKLLGEVKQFAKETPFNLKDLVEGSKRLLAYNVSADKLIPTLGTLGDITAGVGRDKLPQLILAFGQVKAATKLTGAELRQFSEAGVPLLSALADQFNVSASEIQDMVSKGVVGFEDVESALTSMTAEGGKFHNLMQQQSETTLGKVSNLEDSVDQLKDVLGQALTPSLKNVVEQLIPVVDSFKEWSSENPQIISDLFKIAGVVGGLATGYMMLGPAIKPVIAIVKLLKGALILTTIATGKLVAKLLGLGKISGITDALTAIRIGLEGVASAMGLTSSVVVTKLAIMKKAFIGFSKALLTNPITWVILGIIATVALLYKAWTDDWGGIQEKTTKAVDFITKKFEGFTQTLENFKTTFNEKISSISSYTTPILEKMGIDFDTLKEKVGKFEGDPLMQWQVTLDSLDVLVGDAMLSISEQISERTEGWIEGIKAPFKSVFYEGATEDFKNWLIGKYDSFMEDVGVWVTKMENKLTSFWSFGQTEGEEDATSFKDWLVSKYDAFMEDVGVWVTDMSNALSEWWRNLGTDQQPAVEDGMSDLADTITKEFDKNRPQILTLMARTMFLALLAIPALIIAGAVLVIWDLFNFFKDAIKENAPRLYKWLLESFVDAIDGVKNYLFSKAVEFKKWGKNIAESFVDGFWDALSGLKQKAIDALELVKGVLKGNSPPKEGPFKEIDKWGFNIGEAWAEGMEKGMRNLNTDRLNTPSLISQSPPNPTGLNGQLISENEAEASNTGSNGGGATINFNVTIGMYAGSETEKRNIAADLYAAILQVAQSQNKTVAELMGG